MKLPNIKTVRNKCDAQLTPIVKAKYPKCLLLGTEKCTGRTAVAHHHIHKSKSSRLRYEMDNLINLCNHCHLRLHCNESYWASKIVEIKGIEWFRKIDKIKDEYVKTDVHFYINNLARLKDLCEKAEWSSK